MNNIKRNRNVFLDILRGIACILIIFIHRPFPGAAGNIISAIARSGVAIFFIISGYYTHSTSAEKMLKSLPRKIWHTAKILFFALLFYFVWETFVRWAGTGWSSVHDWITNYILNPGTWYLALMWDRDPLAGHLWFLFSLVRCYIIFAVLLKLRLEKKSCVISLLCLSAALIMQKAHTETLYFRNGWFYGMGFFMAGYAVAARGKSFDRKRIYLAMIVGGILSIIGGLVYPKEQIYVGTIILSISSFCWAVTQTGAVVDWPVTKILAGIGAKYGTYVYVIHWTIMECFLKLDKMFTVTQATWYLWISPIVLAVISVWISILLYSLTVFVPRFIGGKQ